MRRFARFGTICAIKKPAKGCNFTKSNTSSWVIFIFFKLYKWYQIAQGITYKNIAQNWQDIIAKSDSKGLLKNATKIYYELRQLLQNVREVHYKVRHAEAAVQRYC